jgi:hypothetical protein
MKRYLERYPVHPVRDKDGATFIFTFQVEHLTRDYQSNNGETIAGVIAGVGLHGDLVADRRPDRRDLAPKAQPYDEGRGFDEIKW